jgi:hypothetical protein
MNIEQKLAYAKTHVDSIAEHHDAPAEEVAAALADLKKYADTKWSEAQQARAAHIAARDAQAAAHEAGKVKPAPKTRG